MAENTNKEVDETLENVAAEEENTAAAFSILCLLSGPLCAPLPSEYRDADGLVQPLYRMKHI